MAIDTSRFESARRTVNDEYAGKKASNDFGRFVSGQTANRNKADYRRGFGRQQGAFMGNMAQRGLTGGGVRSGSFEQALQQRTGDFTRNLGRMTSDAATQQRAYDLNDAGLEQARQSAYADIEAQKQREIALSALNLRNLAPLYGG